MNMKMEIIYILIPISKNLGISINIANLSKKHDLLWFFSKTLVIL